MTKQIVDLLLYVFMETDGAYLVAESCDQKQAVWLPKSGCEQGDEVRRLRGVPCHEFQIEEYWATEKGLV